MTSSRTAGLGREFGWLWASYAVSTFGTRLAFDAFPLIAILVLHAGAAQVSALAAAGLAVGAVIAVPLGAWVEFRRKRPIMIGADLFRLLALLSVPAAYVLDRLSYPHLIVVAILVAAANIVFTAASGAYLKTLVRQEDLLVANGRFESTLWTATALGPPLGTTAIGLFGPVITVILDAASYLLSALGLRAIRRPETAPARTTSRPTLPEIAEGWRFILHHPHLRPLFFNTVLVSALIMATAPLCAIVFLRDLGFAPWQYGLAFGLPCLGGLLGARLSRPLVARYGQSRVVRIAGIVRVPWLVALAFTPPPPWGLIFVIAVEFALITCMGVFTPVFATHRLQHTPPDRAARVLSAWSITSNATVAALTACWGLLAAAVGTRPAIAIAGVLILATPFLLPRKQVLMRASTDTAPAPVPAPR
ncbi:MFS transporter [Nocardia sp. NPDC127526]|uniref:MFS transporter n=1 Tax=Nocardia sp. NPDC127526 TaxID=3345393 RepID=UPI003640F75F